MFAHELRFLPFSFVAPRVCRNFSRFGTALNCGALVLLLASAAMSPGQAKALQLTPAPADDAAHAQPPTAPQSPLTDPTPHKASTAAPAATGTATDVPGITEDEIRSQLAGKDLFLRGGYLDNTLAFDQNGVLIGHSPRGSYTLCGIRILRVRILKHKVALEGQRYGLHFLGVLPSEDPTTAVDRVDITPKKKTVYITIDRELVIKPRQKKHRIVGAPAAAAGAPPGSAAPRDSNSAGFDAQSDNAAGAASGDRAADAKHGATLSQAHANQMLLAALGNIFAQGFDARMMASMPSFWKLYYQAVSDRSDYRPSDPQVLRQNMVDQKARLLTASEPASNQFAQDYGVAGMSQYSVVVGADGKAGQIVVVRPIGFGLDENAVDSIRNSSFAPAIKDGKPVPVTLDMSFVFRIYSQRTNVESKLEPVQPHDATSLPGPYSLHP